MFSPREAPFLRSRLEVLVTPSSPPPADALAQQLDTRYSSTLRVERKRVFDDVGNPPVL